ncbi:MAG: DNA alkylation repair protein [Candidatus Ancillula sp.]|jgi:3-methyladenine DNA glycosylase AlkD|nr:DNA alkylation repair protein [Candidatus Ancillula sp.]
MLENGNLNQYLKNFIIENSTEKLAAFNKKLSPDTKKLITGCRVPDLRKVAKRLIKLGNFSYNCDGLTNLKSFIRAIDWYSFEETIVVGIVVANLRSKSETEDSLKSQFLEFWLAHADGWAITDTVDSSLKPVEDRDLPWLWTFVKKYTEKLKNGDFKYNQFERRFCINILFQYFLIDQYFKDSFEVVLKLWSPEYYVQMATAWFFQVAAVNDLELTLTKMNRAIKDSIKDSRAGCEIDKFTYNKSLQKMIESRKFSKLEKERFRSLKFDK